jgi:diguanylate cyclase (GGDEF)-like protein
MRINIAQRQILAQILERKRRETRPEHVDLRAVLKEILSWADRFVPSESGSILLDDPVLNQDRKKPGLLFFVACFGKGSKAIIETTLPSDVGIAGRTYTAGRPYISKQVTHDRLFYSAIDEMTKFKTKSIICAPIKIKGATIGVIELINRLNGIDYDANDLSLLKIFAEYTSTLIQNSLDARRFGELSIKDNLTGLYNDRHLYDRLTKDVSRAIKRGSDLSVIFLDLDRFKEINDAHGHLAGSRVLTEVGSLILGTLDSTEATAVRYGGDEFIVILPGAGMDEAAGHAERIRSGIAGFTFLKRRFQGHGKALNIKGHITSSIGVASLRKSLGRAAGTAREMRDGLIKLADAAMYVSKETGRNKITLSEGPAS